MVAAIASLPRAAVRWYLALVAGGRWSTLIAAACFAITKALYASLPIAENIATASDNISTTIVRSVVALVTCYEAVRTRFADWSLELPKCRSQHGKRLSPDDTTWDSLLISSEKCFAAVA